jgi:hypothetical protein
MWVLQAILLLLKLMPGGVYSITARFIPCPVDVLYFHYLDWWVILIPSYFILAEWVYLLFLGKVISD